MHKTPVDHVRSRWGKGKLGKSSNHLMKRTEEAVHHVEGDLTPKKITEQLNAGVSDPEKTVKSTSLSRHLCKLCEVGILEKVRRGVYRLKEDRYRSLGEHMRETGEFEAIYNQREKLQKRREAFHDFLESHEGDWKKTVSWNRKKRIGRRRSPSFGGPVEGALGVSGGGQGLQSDTGNKPQSAPGGHRCGFPRL